ncbi:MAG: type II secretion system F family protein [Acidimicrobiales bacterium]
MTTAILLGVAAGLGLLGAGRALRVRRQTLPARLGFLDADPGGQSAEVYSERASARREIRSQIRLWLGARASIVIGALPSIGDGLRGELASAGWTTDSLAERCALATLAGAILPFALWAVLSVLGVEMPLVLPIWVGLSGAVAGATTPIFGLRRQARKRRRQARRMVGCFLDLVVLALAGGLGIEGALHSAASIGDTRVAHQLVRCLDEARDAGRTPWEALEGLGREIGVPELVELSSAVSLAGTEGARIKSTLAAKAASIRSHELADAEADANTISERLFIPGVLLLIGFLIFIGYPALARLTVGL